MKRLLSILLAASLCAVASAQDLDTLNFVDQLNSGERGNNQGTGTYGASDPWTTASESADYTGADLSGTATFVRYINNYATNGSVESPVMDVTAPHNNPDWGNALAILPANTQPGATGPSTAVFTGDDGGINGLWFGETDDANYYASVDIYCPVFTPTDTIYEVSGLLVRAARDGDVADYSFSDRDGSYGLVYDAHQNTISARKWTAGATSGNIQSRVASTFTQFASATLADSSWQNFKIVANGSNIQFLVNNVELISVTDTEFTNGRAGIYYRENNADPNSAQGVFDNLRAGPASEAAVSDWSMY